MQQMKAKVCLHQMIEFDADTIKDVISRAKSVILTTGGVVTQIHESLFSRYLENGKKYRNAMRTLPIGNSPRNLHT